MKNVSELIQRTLASAGLDPHSALVSGITTTIDGALHRAGLAPGPAAGGAGAGDVIDVEAREVVRPSTRKAAVKAEGDRVGRAATPAPARSGAQVGRFEAGQFSCADGTRDYKLYIPASYRGEPMPLIVMLHGCQQDPDDFAIGTHMNQLADEQGCLVVYPGQASNANPAQCWNWFRPQDQVAGQGEPAILAGLVLDLAERLAVDRQRIFVAGLSAGAAMAVVLGEVYPEIFRAVGAHSGLPYAAASDVGSAFAAMSSAQVAGAGRPRNARPRDAAQAPRPTITFHGDRDTTVAVGNSARIAHEAIDHPALGPLRSSERSGRSAQGRTFTVTTHLDATGRPQAEQWLLQGAGHAWSGGDTGGSFTDANGPDASREMLRFFLAQSRAA